MEIGIHWFYPHCTLITGHSGRADIYFSHQFSPHAVYKWGFYTVINISLFVMLFFDPCMRNVRCAPQRKTKPVWRENLLWFSSWGCVWYTRCSQWTNTLDVLCVCGILTRFHGDLHTAHFLILSYFFSIPARRSPFCHFLIKVWSQTLELTVNRALTTRLRAEWDVCTHAIVPSERTLSKNAQLSTLPCPLCPPRAPTLHSSTLPPTQPPLGCSIW